jgi:hypothetical protein
VQDETSLRDFPPHVRLLAWPELNRLGTVRGVTVTVPPSLAGAPASLACHSRATTMTIASELDEIANLLTHEALSEPVRLVTTLALWDEEVRNQDIYSGNIYLASEGSVARLLGITSGLPPAPERLDELLEQLHALELLYRFPVAFKFRGEHGPERQCRVNGWGRLLLRLFGRLEAEPPWLADARTRIAEHLRVDGEVYRRGVSDALAAADEHGTRVWARIHAEQHIPVLI